MPNTGSLIYYLGDESRYPEGKAGSLVGVCKKGIEQGILTGEVKLLHRQLQLRFGTLPPWAEEKLAHASAVQVEHWGANILNAVSLEEVFN